MSKNSGGSAQSKRDRGEETTKTAKALIDAERTAAQKKTLRLREARLAKEAEDAEAAEVAAKAKAKAKAAPKKRKRAVPAG
ncbi:hypothetical protein [Lutibaculum baratangense]|uniref:Uncharacterized protein n=1 Tax=Lutibaculum baratangense AMV1 TaxID=631454 RepID=V4RD94_9HYPH|nr:hypothetical protein [Lutibaculum baratangense]ESR23359.1 hypothetical protein N177_3427 [Lutibaculum baratangense AMV1]